MALPHYLGAMNLSQLPPYKWDNDLFDKFGNQNDETNPRLANALSLINSRAKFALGVACCQWVVARLENHIDISDALLRIDAGIAANHDWRYAKLTNPQTLPNYPKEISRPLCLALKKLYTSHYYWAKGEGNFRIQPNTQGLIMLVEHMTKPDTRFNVWLTQSLQRSHQYYPRQENVSIENESAVPIEFFDPGFVYSDIAVNDALNNFIVQLDPSKNPYLNSADEMRALGFSGNPYQAI